MCQASLLLQVAVLDNNITSNLRQQLSQIRDENPIYSSGHSMIYVKTDILVDYMGEKARALGSRLKKHQTRTSSAVHEHCSTSGHSIIPDALRSY